MKNYEIYIDGEFIKNPKHNRVEVINPANKEVLSTVPEATIEEVRQALDAARRAQPAWEARSAIDRASFLKEFANLVRKERELLIDTISKEGGKVVQLATFEVDLTAEYFDYMSEWARRYEGEIIPSDRPNEHMFLFKQALGVTTGILPWNFPLFILARKVAPALLTGNTIVLKPSQDTPNNAFEFARMLSTTKLPKGVFNLVSGRGSVVGNELASNPNIDMVSFTGSVETGAKIMEAAGRNIIKVNLELGGKGPAIICADANLKLAVDAIKRSRVVNTGQACNCAERVYVDKKVINEFIPMMVEAMKTTKYGNPAESKDLDMGPLINQAALDSVEGMVERAIKGGAKVLLGGKPSTNKKGFYVEPTVLTDVTQDSEIIQKEVFGPVLPIMAVEDLNQAIQYANDSEYGLSSSIYTQDVNKAMRACKELRFGETFINRENFEALQGFHAGFRKSGIGGADGKHGLEEYLATHVVYLQYDTEVK